MTKITFFLFTILLLISVVSAWAEMQIPSVIGSNMVLQRDAKAALWGWDTPGTVVNVSFRGEKVSAAAGRYGKFLVHLPTGKAGGPFELTIKGTATKTLKDVLVGEVWLAGGQSNMWWQMSRVKDARKEIADACNLPNVRFYDGNTHPREGGWQQTEPKRDIPKARWQQPVKRTVPHWASTAYFFARDLHKELKIPVGIVHIAVPGSAIQPFMSGTLMSKHLPDIWEKHTKAEAALAEKLAEHKKKLAEWKAKGGKGKKPRGPSLPKYETFRNGMVIPVAPFTVKGVIWWQGESNAREAPAYEKLLPELVRQWRVLWGHPDLPFIQVELANFGPPSKPTVSQDAPWPQLREAQRRASSDAAGIYLASVIDIKENPPAEADWEIHPARKQIAGNRLYHAAMKVAYGSKDTLGFGPRLKRAEFNGARVLLHFDSVGAGLKAREGTSLSGFAVAGSDGKYRVAQAKTIDADTIEISSPKVTDPQRVRYNWANNPTGTLINSESMPAGAFDVRKQPGPNGK